MCLSLYHYFHSRNIYLNDTQPESGKGFGPASPELEPQALSPELLDEITAAANSRRKKKIIIAILLLILLCCIAVILGSILVPEEVLNEIMENAGVMIPMFIA